MNASLLTTLITTQLALTFSFSSTLATANTILTESFEAPDTTDFITFGTGSSFNTLSNTWQVTGGSVDVYQASARPEAVAFDQEQAVDLAGSPGAAIMSTSFATSIGETYQLTFYYARNNNLGATLGEARVEIDGITTLLNETIQHDPQIYPFGQNLQFSQQFVADSTSTTLRFTSLVDGVAGITLDAIEIEAVISEFEVPIPSALQIALAFVLLGLAGMSRPRRC